MLFSTLVQHVDQQADAPAVEHREDMPSTPVAPDSDSNVEEGQAAEEEKSHVCPSPTPGPPRKVTSEAKFGGPGGGGVEMAPHLRRAVPFIHARKVEIEVI